MSKERSLKEKIVRIGSAFIVSGLFGLVDIKPATAKQVSHRDGGRIITVPDQNSTIDSLLLQPEVTPAPEEETRKPDYELDFSTITTEELPKYFRIQQEVNYDFNPEWNNEEQLYTANESNLYVKDGILTLQVVKEHYELTQVDGEGNEKTYTSEYTSGKVDTKGFFDFQYGTVEVVAKLPNWQKSFAAGWGLPVQQIPEVPAVTDVSAEFYYQQAGERDWFEFIGTQPNSVFTTLHTYHSLTNHTEEYAAKQTVEGLTDDFHTFTMTKKPGEIIFAVDGVVYFTAKKDVADTAHWPFDVSDYLIFNLAVEGEWLAGDAANQGITLSDNGIENAKFQIKSLKYFKDTQ